MARKSLILLIFSFLLLHINYTYSATIDTSVVDSLKKILPSAGPGVKIHIYSSLGDLYAGINKDSSSYFYKKALVIAKKLKADTTVFELYFKLIDQSENENVAKKYFNKLLETAQKLNSDTLIGQAYQQIGSWYSDNEKNIEAIEYFKKSIKYLQKAKQQLIEGYKYLGLINKKIGNLDTALVYYLKALNIAKNTLHDPIQTIVLMNNIALVHKQLGNYQTALEYFYKIIENSSKIQNNKDRTEIQARTYLNIALTLNLMDRHEEALTNILTAISLFKKIKSPNIAYAYRNIAQTYIDLGKYDLAIKYLDSARSLSFVNEKPRFLGNIYYLMAKAELEKAKQFNNSQAYMEAIRLGHKALDYLKITNSIYLQNKVYELLYQTYAALGNYKLAFQNAINYIKTNQIIFSQEKTKAIQEMEAKYQAEKKQQEIEKQKLIIEKQNIEVKRQRMQRNALIAIVFLMAALAYVAFRSYQQKKRDNLIIQQKNKELEQAYEEIRVQRDQLQIQKDKIQYLLTQLQDSIHYAERIQSAAMPTRETMAQWFDEYFVFFRPRDIVSGDFYWAKLIQGRYLAFTVADCTGHGVPGAFVSMLGISLLNEITQRRDVKTAAQVLEEMRKAIKESLKQTQDFGDSKDGMDIAFCVYDKQTHILQFAGANNPLYFIRNGELTVYPAVKNPVAIYIREKKFETHEIQVQPGDTVYLSSDGFYDQPGGPDGKKYLRKRFKEFIVKIWDKPMSEQEKLIEQEFESWKGDHKQLDDVCVMGVRFLN